jgi:hypothetical protein
MPGAPAPADGKESVMTDEPSDEAELQYFDLAELIPSDWHNQPVLVSSHRAYRLPKSDLVATEPFDLVGVKGQMFWGGAPYREFSEWTEPTTGGGAIVYTQVGDMRHTPEGAYLMLMTPAELGSPDPRARSRLQAALALLRLVLGRNVAVSLLSEFIYVVNTSTVTVLQNIRPPDAYPPPDLSSARRELISGIEDAIKSLDEQSRHRVELSLQWLFQASETYGVNGFLMYWFALDVLAMPRSGRLAALNDQMAEIYSLDTPTVKTRFRLGTLLGLRDRIVHDGFDPQIHMRLLDYLAAVYWDLLLHALNLTSHRAADRILAAGNVDAWFPQLAKKLKG